MLYSWVSNDVKPLYNTIRYYANSMIMSIFRKKCFPKLSLLKKPRCKANFKLYEFTIMPVFTIMSVFTGYQLCFLN